MNARQGALDMRAGGWILRAAVYPANADAVMLAAVQDGIREGIRERAAGHEVTGIDWWQYDQDIPARLRQIQSLAHWSNEAVDACLVEAKRLGQDARLLVGLVAVDERHPENR